MKISQKTQKLIDELNYLERTNENAYYQKLESLSERELISLCDAGDDSEDAQRHAIESRHNSEIVVTKHASQDMVCKTCKYSEHIFSGRKSSTYMAGSCEKYDVKPSKVYFDAELCDKYIKK